MNVILKPATILPLRTCTHGISAQCSVPFAGGPQVCSEVITVAARSSATSGLLNTLVSLLIPDLPVFIYWRSFNEK